jgi:hypothetical protein
MRRVVIVSLSALLCTMHSFIFHWISVVFLTAARMYLGLGVFLHLKSRDFFIRAGVGGNFKDFNGQSAEFW